MPDGLSCSKRTGRLHWDLGKAIEYALDIGVGRIWQRIQFLATVMRRQLEAIEGITVHDNGEQKCGIVTFSVHRRRKLPC